MLVSYEQQSKQVAIENKWLKTENRWLKTAEYLTIVASVAGILAAAVSRQVIFSSAPLTLALILNLLNRQQTDRQTRDQMEADVEKLRQDFYELDRFVVKDIDMLRQQLLARPTAPEQMDINYLKGAVAAVQQEMESRLAPIEALDLQPVQEGLTQFREELTDLEARLQALANQAVPDLITFQHQLDELHQKFELAPPDPDPTFVDQRFEELRLAIAELEQELQLTTENTLAEAEGMTALTTEVRELHQRQGTLEQQIIAAVRSEMQSQLAQLSHVGFASIHQSMAELTSQMIRLQESLQGLTPQNLLDLTPLQAEIESLKHRIEQLPPPFNPEPLELRLDELKAVIVRLEQEAENSPLKHDLAIFFSAMRGLSQATVRND